MKNKTHEDDGDLGRGDAAALLRAEAERSLSRSTHQLPAIDPTLEESKHLIHELQVHQIELEMQNEELRRAQLEIERTRARYFDLYDMAPVGYLSLSDTSSILEANLAAARLLKTPRVDLIAQPFTKFIVADDQDTFHRGRRALMKGGQSQRFDLRLRREDAPPVWVHIETTMTQATATTDAIRRLTMSDISEARALQAELAHADRLATMGLLAAGVAHEINNPLTYLLYAIEEASEDFPKLARVMGRCRDALREHLGDDALRELSSEDGQLFDADRVAAVGGSISLAATGARRILPIARGLTSFSLADSGAIALVDLAKPARDALAIVGHQLRRCATVDEEYGCIPAVLASEGQLVQVFLNLLINAMHAIEAGRAAAADTQAGTRVARIGVRTWVEGSDVCAEVTDTGVGVPVGDEERIFTPLFTTKAAGKGTGLGLAVSRRIVAEARGSLAVECGQAGSTRFVMRFPVAERKSREAPGPMMAAPCKRGRVVVVDDDELVLKAIVDVLSPLHEVVAVTSGQAAMQLFGVDRQFDVVLCDVMMVPVSGIALHSWLSTHHARLASRFLFMTGGAFLASASRYMKLAATPCMSKPLAPAALMNAVANAVAESQARHAADVPLRKG